MCNSITWPLTQSLQIAAAMVIIKKNIIILVKNTFVALNFRNSFALAIGRAF